jgi:hypothetical protein
MVPRGATCAILRIEDTTDRRSLQRLLTVPHQGNFMTIRQFALCTSSLAFLTIGQVGCSNTTTPVQNGTGGKNETGGATSSGGVTGNGGTQATGGAGGSGSGSGGVTSNGGSGSGGTTASGGSKGTGGGAGGGVSGSGSGGATASGGSALGGTSGSGGSGGKSDGSVGGTTGAGGVGSGGISPTGGANTSGGAPGSGGATVGADGGLGGNSGTGGGTGAQHWVGTWSASPYYDSANQPPSSLSNSVLRQVTHVSLGGSQIACNSPTWAAMDRSPSIRRTSRCAKPPPPWTAPSIPRQTRPLPLLERRP